MSSFGKRLEKARKRRGWTQEELEARTGYSVRTISKWENDEEYPPKRVVVTGLAAELGVRMAWLERDEEPMFTGGEPLPIDDLEKAVRALQRRMDAWEEKKR